MLFYVSQYVGFPTVPKSVRLPAVPVSLPERRAGSVYNATKAWEDSAQGTRTDGQTGHTDRRTMSVQQVESCKAFVALYTAPALRSGRLTRHTRRL